MSTIKQNKLQPQLTMPVERLPVITKVEQDISFNHLRDDLSKVEDSDQYLINEFNGKEIQEVHFDVKSIKHEEIVVKSEDEDDYQFNINDFNGKQIQEEHFDLKSIKQEEIQIKSEDEGDHQFKIESSAVANEKGLHHPPNDVSHLNDLYRMNTNNTCVKSEDLPVFKCLKCSYQTHQERLMSIHILCHKSKVFHCPRCLYQTNRQRDLKRHQLVHIPKEEAEMYKCPKCPFESKRKNALSQHLIIHKNPDEITWYHCLQCPYKFKWKNNLKQHMKTHRKDLPMYKCTLCSYESHRKYALQNHLKHVHLPKDNPSIRCPEKDCSYKTSFQEYLANHIILVHKHRENFKCPKCPYETKRAQAMKEHKLGHENPEKWHSCHLCSFRTPYKTNIIQHALVHIGDSEIKWFSCSGCSFKTKHKGSLKQHKLKHSSEAKKITDWFHCYVCMWRTPNKQSLTRHIRTKHRDPKGRICGDL